MGTNEMNPREETVLLPVPGELLEEAGLLSCDVIQYSAAPGKLVIQAIRDPELLREVYGEEDV